MKNQAIDRFKSYLNTLGVELQLCWTANRGLSPNRYDDVYFYALHGRDGPLKHNTMIIIDYGEGEGFGTYVDGLPISTRETAQELAKLKP